MKSLPTKCRNINAVPSFCDCIKDEGTADSAAQDFCKRAADSSGVVTGDALAELKKALTDLDDTADEDDSCCEC